MHNGFGNIFVRQLIVLFMSLSIILGSNVLSATNTDKKVKSEKDSIVTELLFTVCTLKRVMTGVLDQHSADYHATKCAICWITLKSITLRLKKSTKSFTKQEEKDKAQVLQILSEIGNDYDKLARYKYFDSKALKATHNMGRMLFIEEKFDHNAFLLHAAEVITTGREKAVELLDPNNIDALSAPLYAELVDELMERLILLTQLIDIRELDARDIAPYDERIGKADALFLKYSAILEERQWSGSEKLKQTCKKWK